VAFPPFFSWCFWEGYHAASRTQFVEHYRTAYANFVDSVQ